MCNILYFVISFVLGWILGSVVRIIQQRKREIPLLTPEEKEMYKLLKTGVLNVKDQVHKYEELINGQSTKIKRKGR